jgi:hypothetical protein
MTLNLLVEDFSQKSNFHLSRVLSFCLGSAFLMRHNALHMACGSFEALPCPPKPRLATERKPCWQPFTRHKLYALLAAGFILFLPFNHLDEVVKFFNPFFFIICPDKFWFLKRHCDVFEVPLSAPKVKC